MRLSPALIPLLALAACASEPLSPPPEAPVGPPVDFAGSGEMPCSVGAPTYDAICPFRVTRGAGGSVALRVEKPAPRPGEAERLLLNQDGVWTTLGGSIAESDRDAEATLVVVDGVEFYAVPHDALTGNVSVEG